jgi:prevent-host-death family protein
VQKVTLEDAQKHLPELVRNLPREGELLITDADRPVARLMPVPERTSLRNSKPQSVGGVLRPYPDPEDDILREMLDGRP